MIDQIILIIHIVFIFCLVSSIFIDDCIHKIYSLIFIVFIFFHYISKYGKCGLINIEMYFLKKEFRKGVLFKTIKPIISYKNNIFYDNFGTYILFVYIIILMLQTYSDKSACKKEIMRIFNL